MLLVLAAISCLTVVQLMFTISIATHSRLFSFTATLLVFVQQPMILLILGSLLLVLIVDNFEALRGLRITLRKLIATSFIKSESTLLLPYRVKARFSLVTRPL